MPGIVGIISRLPRMKNEEDLNLMIDCMKHEPFYTWGTYLNEEMGLYAGWVCHKDSFADCMPIYNERRDLVLLFSGENFADKEVTDQLRNHGHDFDDSNASYLIHLYEERGIEFLQDLNGWFSGILIDAREKKLLLFNDRYGMQRIYYHESKDTFLFSSEAKSLLKVRPDLRESDMESLGQIFICDCVLQNRSLFSNISLLPGGSVWTFRNANNLKKKFYFEWNLWENQPLLGEKVFFNRLKETFLDILPRYFFGKKRIALDLTSGLDTRLIVSSRSNRSGELPCYTFGGMYRDSLDITIARKIADVCNQAHHVLRLDGKFLRDFPNSAEKTVYLTDGCLDVYSSHDIYFNRYARQFAPIRMTGKFGSEILRSQSMLRKPMALSKMLFHSDFDEHMQKGGRTLTETLNGHKLSFALFKEIPWNRYGRLAVEQSQLTVRTPYMDSDLVKLMYQAPQGARTSEEIQLRLIKDNNPKLSRIMTDRGTAGQSNFPLSKCAQLFNSCLFKAEYNYLWKLPYCLTKLDYLFGPLHPERLIAGRYQFGYYRIWFRNELSDYIRDILLDSRTANRPYLNKAFVEKMVFEHIKGNRNYVNEINKTLTAELIHRLLIEDK